MSNSHSKITKSYSKAFLGLHHDLAQLEESSRQLKAISIGIEKKMKEYIFNEWTERKIKLVIWRELSKDLKIDEKVLNFITVMIMNNRMKILNKVIDCIEKNLNAKKGIKNLEVKTSFDVDVEIKQQIESDLEKAFNSKIEADFVTDKSILGGFIAHSDSEILDLSVKRRFDEIRRAFNIS